MHEPQQVYHISVDTLDEQFLESLREKYPHASLEIKVGVTSKAGSLTDDQFWSLVERLDWSQAGDDEAVIEPLVVQLSSMPLRYIYEFQDLLSEKLFQLDTRQHAENVGENAYHPDSDAFFSPDEFLYARCCVVANGRTAYHTAKENPEAMPKDLAFEALLRVARNAYQRKTGQPFRYVPSYNIETFGNKEGWK
jgi:hypothetical protein